MHITGDYDFGQDRMLLRFWNDNDAPSEDKVLWLTRRQWLAIAMACYRARSTVSERDERPDLVEQKAEEDKSGSGDRVTLRETGSIGPQRMPDKAGDCGKSLEKTAEASLVSEVRFQQLPSGLRIKMTAEGKPPLILPLKGEKLPRFIRLVERLAARAKWDLPAAVSRLGNTAKSRKRVMH